MTHSTIDQTALSTPTALRRTVPWLTGSLVVFAAVILLFVLWWIRPHPFHGMLLQSPERAADFTLTASTGASLRLSDLRGKIVLLFFGYTTCPDVCPLTLAELKQMRQLMGDQADQVQVLLLTVDPTHDTPEKLAHYLAAFDETFVGLTGPVETLSAVATEFGVFFDDRVAVGHADSHAPAPAASLPVEHTSTVVVVDADGYTRLLFPPGMSPADMAEDVKYLIKG
jgi:protein SCO1/2